MATFLFIGGTGIISAAAVRRATGLGHRVTALNRGRRSSVRPLPEQVEVLTGDIRDARSIRSMLRDREFDAVVEFVAFVPKHVRADLDLFAGRTGQYVLISSASAYQKPPTRIPITEETPLENPFWDYSKEKIACERVLQDSTGISWTIIRPSHTYDRTVLPIVGGWTVIERMRHRLPIFVHGDGTSFWTLTHADDLAVGLVGVLGKADAYGRCYHITSDDYLTWNDIYHKLGRAAGVEPKMVHVASDTIAKINPAWGPVLVGDRAFSTIFDNTKIRSVVPDFVPRVSFDDGAQEIISWFDADPARRVFDVRENHLIERVCSAAALSPKIRHDLRGAGTPSDPRQPEDLAASTSGLVGSRTV